jgi:2-polyprenyl-3-methyl-5-hydroxy-6-metoxy-1,4-benzoquinol methylase
MWCKTVPSTEEALTTRLLESTIGALELYGIYLGKELGLYDALKSGARVTPGELALAADIDRRYAREWLEQQAVAGLLKVENVSAAADQRQYYLPVEHVNVLASEDHPAHLAPLAQMVAGIGGAIDRVLAAYRSGDGVAYADFGAAFRRGQSGINRPAFLHDLVQHWIPAMPEVHAALLTTNARVADVGCGAGWSTIAMARAFPRAAVIGFDADDASVHDARHNARTRNVPVRFDVRDAEDIQHEGPFDVVLVLEALHDMARPVEALRSARASLAPGGSVIVADEKVSDHFHAPADDLERLMYGWSIVHCLPVSRLEQPSAAIGTVMRTDIVRALAAEAGFTSVDVVPVDGGFFRIYQLKED